MNFPCKCMCFWIHSFRECRFRKLFEVWFCANFWISNTKCMWICTPKTLLLMCYCVTVSVQEQLGKSFTVRLLILTRDYRRQSEYFFLLAGHLGFLTGCVRTWGEANSLEEVVASERATRCYGCTNIASKRLKREVGGEIITWAIEKHFIKKIVVP